jgi:signal transduction histidine kinase
MANGIIHSDYVAAVRAWERRTGLLRRISNRFGLQGKLVICFLLLLSAALGGSSWVYLRQSKRQLSDMIGEQARQISYALAMASKSANGVKPAAELHRIGRDLLDSRNILFVGFLDANGKPIDIASRNPSFNPADLADVWRSSKSLMQVHLEHSPEFGDYTAVVAPILGASGGSAIEPEAHERDEYDPGAPESPKLLGYVAVGLSQAREQAELLRINLIVVGIGFVMVLISLPMAYLLVYRVFFPIRQLVDATKKIADGDLEASVAIDRPDVIGVLARSFNEMVNRVRRQQEDLEAANEKLAEANRDLEEKVHQRTGQLEAANKRLSSEIAEKEDFLRAVSHDLNAPLRNISGMATVLLMKHREAFDEDVINRLERIQKNVQVETDLIAELLELSRIKTRRHKMEPVEVGAMVHELAEVLGDDLRSRRIALLFDAPLPVLTCERARLQQVFQNLIDNAIKYMGDGPVREIHVGCQVRESEVEFYVTDTGIGIDPEDIDKVFYIFRRGKNAAHNIAGKGVGLASVKSIIETYSGTIWVESALGKGSTFRFTINGQHVASPLGAGAIPMPAAATVAAQ